MPRNWAVFAWMWTLSMIGCGGDSAPASGTGGTVITTTGGMTATTTGGMVITTTGGMGATGTAPTFAEIKSQILDPRCNILGCHQNPTDPKNSLNMAADPYNALLAQSTITQKAFVVPGDPANSYLLEKLQSATPTSGMRMPIGVPLSADLIAMVNDWIAAGAPNN